MIHQRGLSGEPSDGTADAGESCPLIGPPVPGAFAAGGVLVARGCSGRCCRRHPADVGLREDPDLRRDLGEAMPHGRRWLLLGGPDPLAAPFAALQDVLRRVAEAYPEAPLASLAGPLLGRSRTPDELQGLAELGLRRVIFYLGSASPVCRVSQGRPFTELCRSLDLVRGAGPRLSLGLVISAHPSGSGPLPESHAADTARFIRRLRLRPSDAVYLNGAPGRGLRPGDEPSILRTLIAADAARGAGWEELRDESGAGD